MHKGILEEYPRVVVTNEHEMGNEQIHGKIGRKNFTEFFYILFASEACECITYSKHNNEKGKLN